MTGSRRVRISKVRHDIALFHISPTSTISEYSNGSVIFVNENENDESEKITNSLTKTKTKNDEN